MAAGNWTFTNAGRTSLLNGDFDLNSDTYKMQLHTSGSNIGSGSTTLAGVSAEVGTTNTGYTTGGIGVTLTLAGTTTVTVAIQTAPIWTAGSANLTARWAVIGESGGNVLCYALLDSTPADVTATNGNTLTVGSDGGTVFTLA